MSQQNFRSILTGSFSTPCDDNPTVAMIEAAYRHHDINARYINCDVKADGLKDAVAGARAMEWVGFNCSLPHKVAVIEHLDELAEAARIIGAVNCVSIRDGRLIGDNTDGKGFLASLKQVADPAGKKVLLLGDPDAMPPLKVETLRKGLIVADVIPNPPRTRLLREAEGRGCTVLDGLGMLVNKGVIGVEHWLGKRLDAGVMEQALKDIFGAA